VKPVGRLSGDLLAKVISSIPRERVRNFAVIAHVDHGKSSLSTAILEQTDILQAGGDPLYTDKLQVEKERGITVKSQTASLFFRHPAHPNQPYLLNLIDTPGHVDFSYEVSRSLSACEGAVLLVDASKGVQAQTMANFLKAFELDLSLIPVVNKIDLPSADVPRVCRQMFAAFDFPERDIVRVSAKNGVGVQDVLCSVVDRLPPPAGSEEAPLRALLFDSWYDRHRGVISLVRMIDGRMQHGDQVKMAATQNTYTVQTVGVLHPEQTPTGLLRAGQVGYVVLGMKDRGEALVGDTLMGVEEHQQVEPLPGFAAQKPMVFAGIFPEDSGELNSLNVAIQKLTLNDPSVTVRRESNGPLGAGFHCGFLGLLHMDVFMQRLEQEHGASLIATAPTVPYRVLLRDGTEREVDNAADFPSPADLTQCSEPWVECKVVMPTKYLQDVAQLVMERRGHQLDQERLDDSEDNDVQGSDLAARQSAGTEGGDVVQHEARSVVTYAMPLGEVVVDFYDHLKQLTAGYASLDYEETGYEPAELVKLEIHVNQEVVPPLSLVVHREKAIAHGRKLVNKLKEVISRDLFQIQIQAVVGGKVVASHRLSALRKDVTAKCYGGDVTRKMKLRAAQKEGKKRMRTFGKVRLSQEAFFTVLKTR